MKILLQPIFFIKNHRILISLAILFCTVACAAYFSLFYYPSDIPLYEDMISRGVSSGVRKNTVQNLCAAPSTLCGVSPEEFSSLMNDALGDEYRKNDPYSLYTHVIHFATGRTGAWLDEKRSFALPVGSAVKCPLTVPDDARLSFDALFCSSKNYPGAMGSLSVTVICGSKRETLALKEIHPFNRDAQTLSTSPASRSFPAIAASSGWNHFSFSLLKYAGKKVEIAFVCAGEKHHGVCVVGNPEVDGNINSVAKRYNVIHILFDAMSQKYMGIYNKDSSLTPNFDRASDDFFVFDRMYSLGTKTRVSVSGFLTSKLPPETGHGYNFNVIPDNEKNIFYGNGNISTLPRVLADNGYATLQVGNCGFTNPVLPTAVDYGFDSSYEFQAMPYDSTGITWNFMRVVRENKDHPFYCYVHLNTTHKPRITPLSYYVKGYGKMPSHYWRPNVTGATAYADDLFSEMVKFLKSEGLWENTIIVVDSDHGTLFEPSNYGRNFLLEDFSRIPFFLHIPDGLKKELCTTRKRITEATSLLNLAPTLLDLSRCGVQSEKRFSGQSFAGLLKEEDPRGFTDEQIFTYDTFGYTELLRGRFKYTVLEYDPTISDDYRSHFFFLGEGIADARESLVDLLHDPLEKNNLILSDPARSLEMRITRLKEPAFPHLTVFTVLSSNKGTDITVTAGSHIAYADLSHRDAGDSVKTSGLSASIHIAPSEKDKSVAIRTVPDDAPVQYTMKQNDTIVRNNRIAAGEYLLPLVTNPGTISKDNARSLVSIGLYPPMGIRRFKEKPAIAISRMDVRWWQSGNADEDNDGANTNMKDVLKSWGYIQ